MGCLRLGGNTFRELGCEVIFLAVELMTILGYAQVFFFLVEIGLNYETIRAPIFGNFIVFLCDLIGQPQSHDFWLNSFMHDHYVAPL